MAFSFIRDNLYFVTCVSCFCEQKPTIFAAGELGLKDPSIIISTAAEISVCYLKACFNPRHPCMRVTVAILFAISERNSKTDALPTRAL